VFMQPRRSMDENVIAVDFRRERWAETQYRDQDNRLSKKKTKYRSKEQTDQRPIKSKIMGGWQDSSLQLLRQCCGVESNKRNLRKSSSVNISGIVGIMDGLLLLLPRITLQTRSPSSPRPPHRSQMSITISRAEIEDAPQISEITHSRPGIGRAVSLRRDGAS
jgi:hypothetical protein